MHFSTTVILTAAAAERALATGWTFAAPFSSPANTANNCTVQQSSGYDWKGLNDGSFTTYGNNDFKGWTCGKSHGKRDELSSRAFQPQVIQGNLDEKPSIGCSGEKDRFSIEHYQVSSDKDTDFEAHYKMPDGSSCRQVHTCRSQGSVIKNTQCGGATAVTFKNVGEKKTGCQLGVHSINFNCGPASSSKYTSTPTPTTSTKATSSTPATSTGTTSIGATSTGAIAKTTSSGASSTTSATATGGIGKTDGTTSTASSSPTSSSPTGKLTSPVPATTSSQPGANNNSASSMTSTKSKASHSKHSKTPRTSTRVTTSLSTSTVRTTVVKTLTSCAASVTNCPASKASVVVVTETVDVSTTICPVTATETFVNHGSNSTGATSTGAVAPTPTPQTVGLLPQCLNTWMFQANCKDNKDYACYCPKPELITNVMGCVKAWAKDENDANTAATFLMGLCAPFVPQNPAIITAYTMQGNSSAPKTSGDAHVPFATTVPVESTKTFYSSHVVTITSCAATITNCPANSTIVKTTSTPVSYQTFTTSQMSVDTVMPPKPSVTASTMTEFSTFVSTITSCGASITNCPANAPDLKTTVVTTSVATRTQTLTITLPPTQPATITGGVGAIPSTTIVIDTTVMVPCTYTNGPSVGLPIPSSSTASQLKTSVTVPQVALKTDAPSPGGDEHHDDDDEPDVGLVYGPPPADITSSLPMTTPALPTWNGAVPTGYGRNNVSYSGMASTARASALPSSAGRASPSPSSAPGNATNSTKPHTGAAIKAQGPLYGGAASTFLIGGMVVFGVAALGL